MSATRRWALGVLGLALVAARPAFAWDPATTHSGLTNQAVAISRLHGVLAQHLGRPLGAFEPIHIDLTSLGEDTARPLKRRLDQIDPASGDRPGADGAAPAFAWVRAGAVLAMTPPERGRNHFLDPRDLSGLDDAPGLSGALHVARLTVDGGATVRDAATGTAFALEGKSALDWLRSPQNDLGVRAFFAHLERAVAGNSPKERDSALVQALLALGGTLAVLEDMGQPAFVRNDFRGEFLADEAGSALERFVADRYGAVALPAAREAVARPDFESFFIAGDGQGLAQRTQQRFFSPGTVPRDVRYVAGGAAADLLQAANESLPYPAPQVANLEAGPVGRTRYLVQDGLRVLAYQRQGSRVHFFLDASVYADCARAWLPVISGYAAGLIDHLLRVQLDLALGEGAATIKATGASGSWDPGAVVHVLVEDAAGNRRELRSVAMTADATVTFSVPAGARKLAAYLRGHDRGGDFVATAELSLP